MKYLYYTLYRHALKIKANDMPAFSAMLLITNFEYYNIATILQLLPATLQFNFKTKDEGLLSYIIAGLILLTINYFLLYKNLANLSYKYQNESENEKLRGTILLCCYCVVSVVAFFWTITR
jgi:hypothetical protein